MKKQRLSLDKLKVNSFVTAQNDIKGGFQMVTFGYCQTENPPCNTALIGDFGICDAPGPSAIC